MVESIILKNVDSGKTLLFNKESDNYLALDYVDWGTISVALQSSPSFSQIGSVVTNKKLGTRSVTIEGWIIASDNNDMRIKKRNLESIVNPLSSIEIEYNGYMLTFEMSNTVSYAIDEQNNNEIICKFKIDGEAFNPVFQKIEKEQQSSGGVEAKFHFPLVISSVPNPPGGIIFAVNTPTSNTRIINNSDVLFGFKVVIQTNGGTVVNPKITNLVTGDFMEFELDLSLGQRIEIDTNLNKYAITFIDEINEIKENGYRFKTYDSSWLVLDVGENIFRTSAQSNEADLIVSFEWQENRLEVQ